MLRRGQKFRFLSGPIPIHLQELAMARTFFLMLAAVVWLGTGNALSIGGTPAEVRDTDVRFGSLSEAREAVTRVLRAANRTNGRPSPETTRSLVSTYRQLA